MADAQAVIRINIEAAGAEAGARRVNQAIGSVGNSSRRTAAASDNQTSALGRLTRAMNDNAKAGGAVGKIMDDINGRSAAAIPVVGNLISKLMGMGPVAGIIGGVVLGIGALATVAVGAAAKVETWKANLLTMTKSTEAADAAYRELVAFGNNTPFSTEQSVNGFIKMRALGLETSTEIMTSFGNTSAAMGKDMTQMVEAVADATTGEFERLKEFGIKASQEGNKVKFTFQGVTTTVDKNASAIQKYIVGIGNTNFGGAMARQMATAQGAFSQFEDQIFNTLAAMGDGVLNKTVGKVVNAVSGGLAAITPLLSGIMDIVGGLLSVVVDVGGGLLSMWIGGTQGAGTFKSQLDGLAVAFKFLGEWVSMAGSVIGSVMGFAGDIIGMVAGGIRSAFGAAFDWLMPATQSTGQSMGESLVGILRAAQYVAGQLPNIFKVALAELKTSFMQTGAALAAALTGDFSKFSKIDLWFSRTQKVASRVIAGAGRVQQDQRGNRKWIDEAAGKSAKGNIDFAALGKDKPAADKKKSGESDAEKRAKAEKEFWETLKNEAATAELLGIKAEDHKKQLELQKILGRDLVAAELQRLTTATQLVRTNKFLADAAQAHIDAVTAAGISEEMTKKRIAGLTQDQIESERGILEFRAKAAAEGVDLQSAAYQAAEKALRTDLARVDANKLLNQQLDRAVDLADKYSASFRKAQAAKQSATDMAALEVGRANGTISDAVYKEIKEGLAQAALDTSMQFRDEFGQRIEALGDQFQGAFGSAISKLGRAIQGIATAATGKNFGGLGAIGSLVDVFGRKVDGSLNGLGKSFQSGASSFGDKLFTSSTWTKPLSSISDSFGGFKKSFGSMFSKGGDFMSGLGSVLGNAAGGAGIGSAVGSMLGLNSTGSSIGGAIGSIGGPLGSLAGSLIGGALGGLLKKAKWGTATVTNGTVTTRGNKQAYEDNASAAGNSIISTLDNIAAQLGADVGNYSVSLGQYKGKWRVSSSGRSGKLKGKYSDVSDYGKDGAEAALRAAIADAISDGAIVGVRASTNALLKAGDDIEAQMEKALTFENVFKDLKSRLDPVGSALDALSLEFNNLTKIFNEAGATSEEYAQLEQLRTLKLQDIIKEQTSGLRDILDTLNGEASGKSAMAQLTENMAAFASYQSDALAGKQVDQDAYSTLVDKILNNSQSVYGTNSKEYQALLSDLKSTTTGFLTNVETALGVASTASTSSDVTSVLNSQTNAITTNQTLQTDYLAQILSAIKSGNSAGTVVYTTTGGTTYTAINGKLQYV
ncbi:hypothetical protein N6H05_18800 [Sphingobium sp. WTD-1]|uniref:hypothetical protein n=1 Tax=Sphingobium sp. WTD-1 TaxID=2979467 RepID=UPI0024DE6FA9|nr:hypothetical protein [Sphingobium sp. WTD-1]WIA55067.1 hypothetical protein N6H05_18800 [Sphingobium sp. WTD-1]